MLMMPLNIPYIEMGIIFNPPEKVSIELLAYSLKPAKFDSVYSGLFSSISYAYIAGGLPTKTMRSNDIRAAMPSGE